MEQELMYDKLKNIIESYFKLKHVPFYVEVDAILYSLYKYDSDSVDLVALSYLESLVENTDKYINLCRKEGGYLFEVNVNNELIDIMVNIKFK